MGNAHAACVFIVNALKCMKQRLISDTMHAPACHDDSRTAIRPLRLQARPSALMPKLPPSLSISLSPRSSGPQWAGKSLPAGQDVAGMLWEAPAAGAGQGRGSRGACGAGSRTCSAGGAAGAKDSSVMPAGRAGPSRRWEAARTPPLPKAARGGALPARPPAHPRACKSQPPPTRCGRCFSSRAGQGTAGSGRAARAQRTAIQPASRARPRTRPRSAQTTPRRGRQCQ